MPPHKNFDKLLGGKITIFTGSFFSPIKSTGPLILIVFSDSIIIFDPALNFNFQFFGNSNDYQWGKIIQRMDWIRMRKRIKYSKQVDIQNI